MSGLGLRAAVKELNSSMMGIYIYIVSDWVPQNSNSN